MTKSKTKLKVVPAPIINSFMINKGAKRDCIPVVSDEDMRKLGYDVVKYAERTRQQRKQAMQRMHDFATNPAVRDSLKEMRDEAITEFLESILK